MTKRGGSLSSSGVLANVEMSAYNILDSYFNNKVMQSGGGTGSVLQGSSIGELSNKYQKMFAHQLGGSACDSVATTQPVPNPLSQFVPPFGKPEISTSGAVDIALPDITVQPYNKYYISNTNAF